MTRRWSSESLPMRRRIARFIRWSSAFAGIAVFFFGVTGALDLLLVGTGHEGLYPGIWKRTGAWFAFGLLLASWMFGYFNARRMKLTMPRTSLMKSSSEHAKDRTGTSALAAAERLPISLAPIAEAWNHVH
ncbi:hypothetical protein [Paraburkholderia polaris]|nr:hypothetical protein [Paraburkholderia polaris]